MRLWQGSKTDEQNNSVIEKEWIWSCNDVLVCRKGSIFSLLTECALWRDTDLHGQVQQGICEAYPMTKCLHGSKSALCSLWYGMSRSRKWHCGSPRWDSVQPSSALAKLKTIAGFSSGSIMRSFFTAWLMCHNKNSSRSGNRTQPGYP